MSGFLGVICGLKSEVNALRVLDARDRCHLRVRVSGADPKRAHDLALSLLDQGAAGLLSFGLSGGLTPDMTPGRLIVSSAVLDETGTYTPSGSWVSTVRARAVSQKMDLAPVPLYGSNRLLDGTTMKQSLAEQSQAVAVDMESHAVAAACHAWQRPFMALRAIADPVQRSLPRAAHHAVGKDGSIRTFRVLGGLIIHPTDIFGMMMVGQDSFRAHRALRSGARHLIPALLRIMEVR